MEKLASNFKNLEKRLTESEPLPQLLSEKRQLDKELESHFQAFSSNHTSTVLLSDISQGVSTLHKRILKLIAQEHREEVSQLFGKFSSSLWESLEKFHRENSTVELVECLQSKRSLDDRAERLLYGPNIEKTLKKRISLLNKEIEVTSALVSSQQDIINEKTRAIELISQDRGTASSKKKIKSLLSSYEAQTTKILEQVELKSLKMEEQLGRLLGSESLRNVGSMKEDYIRMVRHLHRIETEYTNIAHHLTEWENCSVGIEEMKKMLLDKDQTISNLQWQLEEGLSVKINENEQTSEQLYSMILINEKLRGTIDERDKYISEQEEIIQALEKQVESLSMADVADPKDVSRLQEELRGCIKQYEVDKEEFIAYKLETARASASKDVLIKELQKKLLASEGQALSLIHI